ncbi:LysM peptidoglycan-binding domain-containing protein [Aquimarina addita]
MRNFLMFFLLLIVVQYSNAQQYKSHKVANGENVYRIAKRYNTTPEEIYKMNPTAKEGIVEGQILAIPVTNDKEYKIHTVEKGDTVYNISKKYGITPEAIYELNPEAVNGINLGQVLRIAPLQKGEPVIGNTTNTVVKDSILDNIKPLEEIRKIVSFKTHKVARKETLYGIAKKYNITIDDIKKHNKRLYSEEIKKKDRLRIPVFEKSTEVITQEGGNTTSRISTTTKYVVKPKETKFGIARRHGITIAELEQLNPKMDPGFPVGMELIVPTVIFVPLEETIESGFELYEVQPKETIYSILKRTQISSDSLFKMNPYLRDGLKAGMVITLPVQETKDSLAIDFAEVKRDDLSTMLWNFKPKKIAIMLPFGLENLEKDSRQEAEDYIKEKKGVRVAIDFYKGVLIAIDSAKTKGISSELSVFDTQKNNNVGYLKQVIATNNFDEMDAIIGPLYQANVEAIAASLKVYDTPVFSPISKKESKLYGNFFQTRPTDIMLQDKVIKFVEKDSTDKNIILIIQPGAKFEEIRKKLTAKFPAAKVAKIEKGNYLHEVNLRKVLAKNKPNWIFLESDDVSMISNINALLNAKAESNKITLFTTDKNDAFDDDNIKNEYWSKLHLHYPSIDKEFDNSIKESTTPFVARYIKENNGTIPSKYAVRGFDITYDILMRLGSADDLYHAATFEGTTEYVENKFNYAKKTLGGYFNKACYLIKFDDNLKLTVIE